MTEMQRLHTAHLGIQALRCEGAARKQKAPKEGAACLQAIS